MNEKCPNDALIKYLEERISGVDRRLLDYIVESQRAIDKAENNFNERILTTGMAHFITRETFDAHVRDKMTELRSVEEFISNLKGRMTVTGSIIVVFSGVLAAAISLAVKYF